jgi:hypothetical protein
MNIVCSYCNALGFACERKGTIGTPHFGQLRSNGRKAMFQNYLFFPSDLIGLYVDDNEKATYFRKHICYFNSGMAMTSFTAGTEAPVCKYGPAVYRISDILYCRIGAITAYEGCTNPKFVQTYFDAPEERNADQPEQMQL